MRDGCVSTAQLAVQPRLRERPVRLDGARAQIEEVRDFLEGEAAEVLQLDDLPLLRVERREALQRIVELQNVHVAVRRALDTGQGDATEIAATLLGAQLAHVVDEATAQDLRRQRQELGASRGEHCLALLELQIALVHELGRVEGAAPRDPFDGAPRDVTQGVVVRLHVPIERAMRSIRCTVFVGVIRRISRCSIQVVVHGPPEEGSSVPCRRRIAASVLLMQDGARRSSGMMRTIDPERYARVKALFGRAHALDLPARTELLDTQCKDDPSLRREVEDLLRHADLAGGGFLSEDPRAMLEVAQPTRLTIPGYRTLALIDGGGSGVVFRAEQLQPRREVALKVLRFDTLGSCQVARFRREAQLMAQFAHPGIAQVLAAGMAETDAGPLPWIAMELVRGRHLGEHLRATRLDVRGIVDLFIAICDAVEHAHARGVVHRDLKPSNVMVDEEGRPKVLDFGIARSVVDERDTHERTRTGLVLGTLAYMPPEQARGDRAAVGPSGDVYALGAMLFEALTGALPVDIEATDVLEAVRLVCEAEPRRPRQLAPSLSRDLETILLKALEKDPRRRYANAGALGADLANWRANRPIVARRVGFVYRSVRFVQRHRALTAGAFVVVTALATGLALALGGLRAEREARVRTSAALEDLAAKIFDLAPQLGFGEEQRSGLEEVQQRIEQQLVLDPENRALRAIRARALVELMILDLVRGEPQMAEMHGHAARATLESLTREQPDDLDHWTALSQLYARLGEARRDLGDLPGRRAWFQRAFELDERLVREHPRNRELAEDLGWSLSRMVEVAESEGDEREVRRLIQRRVADALVLYEAEPDNWKYVYNLSHAYAVASTAHCRQGDLAAARSEAEESVRLTGRLMELQRGRRDFIQRKVGSYRVAMAALEASGDEREALRYSLLVLGAAFDLFYGDPLREVHCHILSSAVFDAHRLAARLGDGDCLARVRSSMHEALELARLARVQHETLAGLESMALQVGAIAVQDEPRAAEGGR